MALLSEEEIVDEHTQVAAAATPNILVKEHLSNISIIYLISNSFFQMLIKVLGTWADDDNMRGDYMRYQKYICMYFINIPLLC